MKKLILLIWIYFISTLISTGQEEQLKTVRSIYEAEGKNAVLIAANGKSYKIDFWEDRAERRKKNVPVFQKTKGSTSRFTGVTRATAKTTNVSRNVYNSFGSIREVFRKYRLPSDSVMRQRIRSHSPRINTEKKGVILKNAYLFAFKKQRDNDYHLIVGDHPNITKAFLMTMEITGLPAKPDPLLERARTDFIDAFRLNDDLSMQAYLVFTDPVPVHVEGPLFFDVTHRAGSVGPRKGKVRFKLRTAWEIHPITHFSLNE